jgi:hypothetical protein
VKKRTGNLSDRIATGAVISGSVRCVGSAAFILFFIVLFVRPIAQDSPSVLNVRAKRAQELIDQLRVLLPIPNEVQIAVVTFNPLVFSVQPLATDKDRFLLTMELGFLLMLKDDELRAAMAHELGHVWIYTHRPFLQTERFANHIGQRVAEREMFEALYRKLWIYEGASGVPVDELLGPPLIHSSASGLGETGP